MSSKKGKGTKMSLGEYQMSQTTVLSNRPTSRSVVRPHRRTPVVPLVAPPVASPVVPLVAPPVASPVVLSAGNQHRIFSCYGSLDDLCQNIKNIISGKIGVTRRNEIYATLKRCLHSRYRNNLLHGGIDKFRNINELRHAIRPMFIHLRTIITTPTNGFDINTISENRRTRIQRAVDHFSIICALIKILMIVNYLNENEYDITNIKYVQNSVLLPDSILGRFIHKMYSSVGRLSVSSLINTFGTFTNNFYMNIDWDSAFTNNTLTPNFASLNNDDKAKIQIIRLFSSIMRIFHSQNFEIHASKVGQPPKIYSTQNDIFKTYHSDLDFVPYSFDTFLTELDDTKVTKTTIKNIERDKVIQKPKTNFMNIKQTFKENYNKQYRRNIPSIIPSGIFSQNNFYGAELINVGNNNAIPIYLDIFDLTNHDDCVNKQTLLNTLNDLSNGNTHRFILTTGGEESINVANISNTLFITLLKNFNETYGPKVEVRVPRTGNINSSITTSIPPTLYTYPPGCPGRRRRRR